MAIRKPQKRMVAPKPMSGPRKVRRDKTSQLLDWIVELGKRIPPDEQALHPVDGAEQLDHYLYRTPKQ